MMVDTGLDKTVHHDREPRQKRILNFLIDDWESDTLRALDQENDKRLMQKYKNLMFLDDEGNHIYMIPPENLEFKGPTRRNKQYFVVGKPLEWKDEDNMYLLISRDINDDFMVLIRVFEQEPDLGVKCFIHQFMMIARLQKVK